MLDTESQRANGGQQRSANDGSYIASTYSPSLLSVTTPTPSHHRPANILIIAQAEDDHPPIYTPPPAYDMACLDI